MSLPKPATLDTYGGAKQNDYPIVDPPTEEDAKDRNEAFTDTAMMTRVALKSWVQFVAAATTGALVLQAHEAQWRTKTPTPPTLTRFGEGVFDITYPTDVVDELDAEVPLNFRSGWLNIQAAGAVHTGHVERLAPNVLRVSLFADGIADDLVGAKIDVFGF